MQCLFIVLFRNQCFSNYFAARDSFYKFDLNNLLLIRIIYFIAIIETAPRSGDNETLLFKSD